MNKISVLDWAEVAAFFKTVLDYEITTAFVVQSKIHENEKLELIVFACHLKTDRAKCIKTQSKKRLRVTNQIINEN